MRLFLPISRELQHIDGDYRSCWRGWLAGWLQALGVGAGRGGSEAGNIRRDGDQRKATMFPPAALNPTKKVEK